MPSVGQIQFQQCLWETEKTSNARHLLEPLVQPSKAATLTDTMSCLHSVDDIDGLCSKNALSHARVKSIITAWPHLKEPIGRGYDGWLASIVDSLKSSRRILGLIDKSRSAVIMETKRKCAWSSSPRVSAEGKVQNSVTVEQHWKAQKIFLPAKLREEYLDTRRSPLRFSQVPSSSIQWKLWLLRTVLSSSSIQVTRNHR